MSRKRVKDSRRAPFVWFDKKVFEQHAGEVGPVAWFVYCGLAYYAWDKPDCFPFHGSLARVLGLARVTVRKALQELRGAGLIEIEAQVDRKGQSSNRYRLLEHAAADATPPRDTHVSPPP
jgi:DNA-binding transcriptional ArsR family regulator